MQRLATSGNVALVVIGTASATLRELAAMSFTQSLKRATLSLSAIGLGFALAAPAYAGPDRVYPSAATATASAAPVTLSTNITVGSDGHTTLVNTVFDGQQIVVTSTWSILDRSAEPGTDTTYPKTVIFAATTEATPGPAVVVNTILSCGVANSGSTCIRDISFAAPAAAGAYQVKVAASSSGGGPLTGTSLYINFTVTEEVEPLETLLTVAQKCVFLNQGDIDLEATLTEADSDPVIAIAGADIAFSVDGVSAGSATTGSDGGATLSYNINHLGVGDYPIYAAFAGNSAYNGSNDSDTLGVSYVFTGFKQPINADGNSVFGNGQVIPIKLELLDYLGQPVPDAAPTVWMQKLLPGGVGDEVEATSVSAADTGNMMRYVPEEGIYIYNMDLKNADNGTYKVFVRLGDSETCSAGNPTVTLTVAKKGKK
jgi:hypothetical protein